MNLLSVLPVCPAVLLSTTLLLPSRVANRIPVKAGKIVRLLLGIQSVMAAILAICVIPGGLVGLTGMPEAIFVGSVELFHLDALACLMFLLISFIGWSVAHFSIRYLDGEPKQGAYFRWLSLAIGMVSIMAISGNLLMLVAAGLIASLAMHQLMVFYKDRTMAQRAAWTKFVISRLGDALLLMACGILYQSAGTLNLTNLFAQSNWATIPDGNLFEIAMGLFVVGALVKSAQFPFHIWLPVSLETPTPVSALMHAGIVNAGGFLLIRISPLVSQVPSVLVIAAVTGLVTAVYGSLVMVTQTSVKKRLAYSTVAQMGFMMLQCGLGAFTAATIHLMAHSLYKAHAFLNSGELDSVSSLAKSTRYNVLTLRRFLMFSGAGVILTGAAVAGLLRADLLTAETVQHGFFPILVIGCASLFWIATVLQFRKISLLKFGLLGVVVLFLIDGAVHAGMSGALNSHGSAALPVGMFLELACLILPVIVFLFVHSMKLKLKPVLTGNQAWFIHARNGFYVDTWLNRQFEFIHRTS